MLPSPPKWGSAQGYSYRKEVFTTEKPLQLLTFFFIFYLFIFVIVVLFWLSCYFSKNLQGLSPGDD